MSEFSYLNNANPDYIDNLYTDYCNDPNSVAVPTNVSVTYLADGTTFTLDYREKAPAAAYRNMFLDDNGEVIKDMSITTRASSGTPGSVDGLLKAWEIYGSGNISLRELITPSIMLAERGFKLSLYEAQKLNAFKELFSKNEAAAKIFIRSDNKEWEKGDRNSNSGRTDPGNALWWSPTAWIQNWVESSL